LATAEQALTAAVVTSLRGELSTHFIYLRAPTINRMQLKRTKTRYAADTMPHTARVSDRMVVRIGTRRVAAANEPVEIPVIPLSYSASPGPVKKGAALR
jgi:hypothetical protein